MFKKIPTLPGYSVDWKTNSVWNEKKQKMLSTFIMSNKRSVYCTPGIGITKGKGRGSKNYSIGRLVLIAKTGVDLSCYKLHTSHIDGNPFNNKPSNLEWTTNKENQLGKNKPGTQKIIHIS